MRLRATALLFLLSLFFLMMPTRATLHCATEASAVSALRGACFADLGCRYFFGRKSAADFADLVVMRLQLVRSWSTALQATESTYHGDDDIRHLFQPSTWREGIPVLLSFGVNDSSRTMSDCATLATDLAHPETSSRPPADLRDAVHMLLEHGIFLSDDRQCDLDSEVPVVDPVTHNVTCMVAEHRVCATTTGVDAGLTTAVYVGMAIALVLMIVLVFTANILFYCKVNRFMRKHQSDQAMPLRERI